MSWTMGAWRSWAVAAWTVSRYAPKTPWPPASDRPPEHRSRPSGELPGRPDFRSVPTPRLPARVVAEQGFDGTCRFGSADVRCAGEPPPKASSPGLDGG